MMIDRVNDVESIELKSDQIYFLVNFGLGDAINQILFIESNINYSYTIVCPERNYELIQFVYDNFIGKSDNLLRIIAYNHPVHGGPGLSSRSVYSRPNNTVYPGIFNIIHTAADAWTPFLNTKYVANFRNSLKSLAVTEKKVILFPERSDNYSINSEFWQAIIDCCVNEGVAVYHNKPQHKTHIYNSTPQFKNCIELNLNISGLVDFIKENDDNILIGQRSGIFDVLKYTNCKKLIIYPDPAIAIKPTDCSLEDEHTKEIMLPVSDNELEQLIKETI